MMTGICQFCEQTYAALPNGPTNECPGCAEHGACEDCGKAPAGDERDVFRCTPCAQQRIDNFDLPSDWEPDYGWVGLVELQDRARGR